MCFLVGQVWEGWEHWRKLLSFLCKAEEFLISHSNLYIKLISILHFQIKKVSFVFSVLMTRYFNVKLSSQISSKQ